MASLPEKRNVSSDAEKRAQTRADKIRRALRKGYTPDEVAKKLAKGDKRRLKVIRSQIYRILSTDDEFVALREAEARMRLIDALPEVTAGVIRRAKTGRAQEAKLVFEASGFHNPKVDHEHSGEISVKLDMPRPPVVETEDQGYVDADVVDLDE